MEEKKEHFPIRGIQGYLITMDGMVWSNKRKIGKYLKPGKCQGYLHLRINNKNIGLHRLMALAFIPNPGNKPEVNHINGSRNDNRIENLEWCTHQENVLHGFRSNGRKHNALNRKSNSIAIRKVLGKKVMQLTKEGILCKIYDSCREAARITGLSLTNISISAKFSIRKAGGYSWRYL